ncbi:alpha/beta hydrolase [Candidatus Nitrotoga sp. M5]|uniref:alpha/beta hydrolase n=1 Tax=Candidatus Nitrotoga sp. M5 TaxID=2890409 RepID=UPI001EF27F3C|nr:alpha/beta fold hydrolase [Candidatus Nitrotoga sp. M5]CAH1385875.1 Hydrolase_4 domain-containing protein [Candidatus Nitrotoga sp. M5]
MSAIKKVSIPGPVGELEVVVQMPDIEPRAIAVIAHPLSTMGGTMENKIVTTLAKTFTELGFAALRFNFRGVGASSGEFDNGNGEVEDALAVTRYALSEYGDLPLILSGFSFGGCVQARAAQQLPQRQLVLIAPAVMRYAMPSVPHNTLLIHGELDEIVPLTDVMQWARPQRLPIVVLPGAEHFFHGRLEQLKEIVRHNFMGQAL